MPSSLLNPVALNKHGTLPDAPFVSMLRASFVHGFRTGPSANEEKLVTRAGYPPGWSIPTLRATRQKRSYTMDNGTDINPDGRNVISRRIVEVTDHDETIFAEFIDLDTFDAWRPQ
jgi:hypothetical protein